MPHLLPSFPAILCNNKSLNKSLIRNSLNELHAKELISENIFGEITLQNNAISYMSNKPRKFFEEISNIFDLAIIFL